MAVRCVAVRRVSKLTPINCPAISYYVFPRVDYEKDDKYSSTSSKAKPDDATKLTPRMSAASLRPHTNEQKGVNQNDEAK